ncbi:OmpA family protein [Vibrio sp. TH_r3]|uniref:OmpA family protein n=1 Tax=Vibrio sp. TH_r3 TaxID=3082084 RepID=UPI0029558520|nr:OmpA family protein [Vibrio sp. TH_r3]MDV7105863.1 OmpA family protein [Vibrio sp. TH_r3]
MKPIIRLNPVVVVLVTALSSPVVYAQTAPAFYTGLQLGYGGYQNDVFSDSDEFIGGLLVGYRYNDYFATQLDYQYLGDKHVKIDSGLYEYDFQQAIVSGRIIYPAMPQLDVSLKLGAAAWFGTENDHFEQGISQLIGGGIHYHPNETFSIGLTYQYIDSVGNDYKMDHSATLLELIWSFGGKEAQPTTEIRMISATPVDTTSIVRPVEKPVEESPVVIQAQDGDQIYRTHILFNFDSIELRDPQQLTTLVETLNNNQTLSVRLEGYASPIGSTVYNQKLSERRAQAVASYLQQKGIDVNRISAKGVGEYSSPSNKRQSISYGQRVDAFTIK